MALLNRRHTRTRQEDTVANTDAPTIEQRIDQLRAEGDDLAAQEAADPARAAADLTDWNRRDRARRDRSYQIEREIRDLEEFGELIDTHPGHIREYLGVARPIAARNAKVITDRVYKHNSDGGTGADRDINEWWQALTKLARRLPLDTEPARVMLTRETEQWFRLRDSWLVATALWNGRREVPSPETSGALPDWLRWGAHRTDTGPA